MATVTEHPPSTQKCDPKAQSLPEGQGFSGRNKKIWRAALGLFLALGLLTSCALVSGFLYFYNETKQYEFGILRTMNDPQRVSELPPEAFPFLHGKKPQILGLDEFPEDLHNALIAREDSRFYAHHGVDFQGVARAILRNLEERKIREGAGTITMQVARTAYGFQARTFRRKLIETMLALRIEQHFSKKEIIAIYMNWVFLGMDNHGFARASQAYFNKPATSLALGESAILVGMLRAPNRLDPVRHPEAALQERDMVLHRMVHEGLLAEAEAKAEMQLPLTSRGPR